jgi:protein arginine kinase activator
MHCDICKTNEATIHLTQIVEGNVRKFDICESCSKAKNIIGQFDFSMADLMLGLGASDGMKGDAAEEQCPACGLTTADFKKTGRLGCGTCWVTFDRGLTALLKDIHKGITHVGKVPMRMLVTRDFSERVRTLVQELEAAIKDERFEEAAALRDQIRQLEAKKASSPK